MPVAGAPVAGPGWRREGRPSGAYIDVGSGVATGLFPDLPRERFEQVGNAAGVGVRRMLASRAARARAAELARACRYVELSSRSDFQRRFLHQISFPGFPRGSA